MRESQASGPDKKIDAYWRIGQRIQEEALTQDVGYYSSVIKDLSRDLNVSTRTLYDAVQFSEVHEEPPESPALTWSHHRILLRLGNKKDRAFYAKLIKAENLSARALEAAIQAGRHHGKPSAKPTLERPTDPEYLYRAAVLGVIDGDTLDLEIDLGFGVFRKLRARLAQVDAPEGASKTARAARDFSVSALMGAKTVCVKTIKVDLHGRYVVHLFYLDRMASLSRCFERGVYLNDVLLREGLARRVS